MTHTNSDSTNARMLRAYWFMNLTTITDATFLQRVGTQYQVS